MSLFINTNIASLYAQNNVANSQSALAISIQRLSSGLRINSAKDDAAGMAIAARMTSQIGGMMQAAQNANDGVSMAQTAEGALAQVTNDLQTIRNLSVQAANGSNSSGDRASIQASISQLQQDISQIASTTQYNGLNLLDGSLSSVQFQIGANAGQTINASIGNASANAIGDNSSVSVTSATSGSTTNMAAAATAVSTIALVNTTGINNFTAQQLQITAGNQTMWIPPTAATTLASGTTAYSIASQVNAAATSTGTPVTAEAHTYATLSSFTAGTVNLTLQGTPTGAGAANPITVSATLSSSTDVTGLSAAINAVSAQTGISAIANTANGTVALTQNAGYDIGIQNGASTGSVKIQGSTSTGGVIGAQITLATGGGSANSSTIVGGQVDFHSSSNSFTVSTGTSSGTVFTVAANVTFMSATTDGVSHLNAVNAIDVTKMTNGLPSGANSALYSVDGAINTVNGLRAQLGALQNRFLNAQASLTTTSTNVQQARSRIQDTDFASETANLTHNQILQQAGTAMLAQANALPNSVLTLLK